MDALDQVERRSYQQRLEALRATKLQQTHDKQQIAPRDLDDKGLILPPPDRRQIVRTMSASSVPVTEVLLSELTIESNHPSGGFFRPKACGESFRALLDIHPTYIDPMGSLAGAYMVILMSYRSPHWNPDFDYSHLHEEQHKYRLFTGIGGANHFCQDLGIGLELGWGASSTRSVTFGSSTLRRQWSSTTLWKTWSSASRAGLAGTWRQLATWLSRRGIASYTTT